MFQISTFESDVTPPVGHPLCAGWYPPAASIRDPLSVLGVVLVLDGEPPIVLCALDWAELSNRDYLQWREDLATAVDTSADRVAIHCTHAHDTPWPDRDAQNLLDEYGHPNVIMEGNWAERVRAQAAEVASESTKSFQPLTDISIGEAYVDRIASNRRVLGDDGKVRGVRWTATRDPELRTEPEGLIDPMLKSIGFWHEEKRIACLHYYAVHPTAMDGTGEVTPEFVGLARNRRIEEDPGVAHIYFTGCAGNITAGKYNDGIADNRKLFTQRIHQAMLAAEAASTRRSLVRMHWKVEHVHLPPREDMNEPDLRAILGETKTNVKTKSKTAIMLAYLHRQNVPIPITCLHINDEVGIMHLPGETFIEYQIQAQESRPDAFIAVAGYGDLGTGYITLERSFEEGGYEPVDAFVSGKSEAIMRAAIASVTTP
jgi:hypothetical protein